MKRKNVVLSFCLSILAIFMVLVCLRFVTKNVLKDRLKWDNAFTKIVFKGAEGIFTSEVQSKDINWSEYYPFKLEEQKVIPQTEMEESAIYSFPQKYIKKIDSIKGKIEEYSTKYLMGYQKIVEISQGYEKMIQWNIAANAGDNEVVRLPDGYLTTYENFIDIRENITSTIELSDFCVEKEIPFLYVQCPSKICKYQDLDISGKLDFANQNADSFLMGLEEEGIPTFDLREELHQEYPEHRMAFYKTDHHWTAETGLWAASVLTERINDQFNFGIEETFLEKDLFEIAVYENWFLGSEGKKVTLSCTDPEDFALIYPRYETSFEFKVPNKEIYLQGDFSVTYDLEQMGEKDYYNLYPYEAYGYGNCPLIQIHNNKISNGKRVLLIRDSFADCMAPFFALGVSDLHVLDVRLFTGSVKNYIETMEPDIVLLMYYPSSIHEIDWSDHKDTFDFR